MGYGERSCDGIDLHFMEDNNADEDDWLRSAPVKFISNDISFRNRLKRFFLRNPSTRLGSRIFDLVIKFLLCFLYIIRVELDDPQSYACGGMDCSVHNLTLPKDSDEMVFSSNAINWHVLVWVRRPLAVWVLQVFLSVVTLVKACVELYIGSKVRHMSHKDDQRWFHIRVSVFSAIDSNSILPTIINRFIRSKFSALLVDEKILPEIVSGCRGWCFSLAMARLGIRVRNRLFGSVIEQEIGFFDKVKTGDITSRLTSDTTVMTDTVTLNMNIFTRNLILGVGIIVFMFKLSWRLSLLTLIAFPIVLGVSKVYGEYYRDLASKVQDALAAANNVAEEALSAIRTVRSFANEDGEKDRYRTSLHKAYKINVKQANVYAGYVWCTQLFELGLTVAVLYYGGHLVLTKTLSGGNLVSFILYQMQLGNCIDEIGEVFTGLMQAAGASEKVFEYIDREPVVKNTVKDRMDTESVIGQSEVESDKISGLIEFKNVTFAYPSRPDTNVLKNVSFTVQPGEVVALVGPSGGGKSSCINLLEHYYEPITGQILLDKKPVKEYDHKFLHTKISLVGQEPVLYARSIKDNIGYGLGSDVTIETVQQAAGMANAHEFIMEMEKQYVTEAGEKGQQLSGGQKQRIAIARALIRKPVVLLLDEATSALDSESEHVVQQAIYKNLKGRSVIIIAHRLSTVEKADRIIVIDKGCVIEEGSHSELLRNNGKYASLVQRQLLQTEDEVEDRVISLDNDGLGVGIAKRDIGLHFRSTCLITSSSWH
ncbi:ATP-binding cassette, subfamily B (MDR/TAP), member 9 [Mytilus galloprovincialis]|uniref:ATP-binding cassette, subfamily B (MDR/TAP), member 9 n=2 Tax=Mytilus galloprovincialis TaxID=29158 RepID=A0A8B6BND0_MYTGA|nr:ATP-binding cassette, subfamily B (MDR/TAP), member 9 [Mytilus galloprovincialis]